MANVGSIFSKFGRFSLNASGHTGWWPIRAARAGVGMKSKGVKHSPQHWIMNEKSLAMDGVRCRTSVITGKATAPPPSAVAPPINEPIIIVIVMG